MRQAQKKKDKDKVAIALMLTFCVIALTSIFTIKSNIDKINGSAQANLPVSDQTKTSDFDKKLPSAPKKQTEQAEAEISKKVPTVDSTQNTQVKKDAAFPLSWPVKKGSFTVTNPYAMDHLIYSVTLDQYMTHSGMDLEAKGDTQVLAAADGTVTSVYTDDRCGITVEITHPDGLVTVYSNLSTDEMAETGDDVKQGQIIGGVGSTARFEALEPPHLHFEVQKDGVYVDPQEFLCSLS